MINVTARAREELRYTLDEIAAEPDKRLRLGPTSPGQLGVFPDIEQEDDEVVEHDGHPVLVLSREIADALAGRTIDVEDTEEGPRFVLKT